MRRVLPILGLVLVAGCGGEEEKRKCGTETCSDRETCDESAMPPVCVCKEAYTGDECAACAIGYRPTGDGECEPVPIDCDADPLICGDHGACVVEVVGASKIHSCECEEGWGGHVCQLCADGWQDNDGDGVCLPNCATAGLTCDIPLVCSDAEGVARCACPTGYAGDDCAQCARGYHDPLDSGECTPTCATAALDCGERERCYDGDGEPRCECIEGYAGEGCLECAEGWQDNAVPGDCRPSCAVVELDCSGHGSCDDASGIAACACDPGWTGARCDACATGHTGEECELCSSGWYRVGDEACRPTCSSGVVVCGSAQSCWNGPDGSECVCEVGYAGGDCMDCDAGFTEAGSGLCVASPPASYTLVTHGTWRGYPTVVAIDPSTGDLFPLRAMSVSGLAFDPDAGTLYTEASGGLAPIDLAMGTTGTALSAPFFEVFTFDTMRGDLLLAGSTGIVRLDPSSGSYATVGSTGVSSDGDAAYQESADRLFVVDDSSSTIQVFEAGTGATVTSFS